MSSDIHANIHHCFKGYARVKLDSIQFDTGRDLDSRNVKRLIGVFGLEGCKRDDPANAISAVVSEEDLPHLPAQNLRSTFESPAQLPCLAVPVICLHGKHRIHAAREVLHISDRWWIVKIFDSNLPLYAREYIRYECPKSLPFCDGDIFRYHLEAEMRGDQESAKSWLAMLSPGKRKRVRQLKKVDDEKLLKVLKPLLPFGSLWIGYDLGPLNHELPMHCREEQYSYLQSVFRVWSGIMGTDVDPHFLDVKTVELFEVLMPANSSSDVVKISTMMCNFKAFPRVQNLSLRRNLEARVLKCRRILTLRSFHRDMIMLGFGYTLVRELFPTDGTTLRKACAYSFRLDMRYFEANYIDLWLQTVRIQDPIEPHDNVQHKIAPCKKSQMKAAELACFAASRGFWSSYIERLLVQNVEVTLPGLVSTFSLALSQDECNIPCYQRWSRPRRRDFEQGWRHISLQAVFQAYSKPIKKYPTAFAVASDMIRAFWGSHEPGGINDLERILPRDQYMRFAYLLDDVQSTRHAISNRGAIVKASDRMQSFLGHLEKSPAPASSVYDDSIRSPLGFSPLRPRSNGAEEPWSERDFIGRYNQPYDGHRGTERYTDHFTTEDLSQGGAMQTGDVNRSVALVHDASSQVEQMDVDAEVSRAIYGPKQCCDRSEETDKKARRSKIGLGPQGRQYRIKKTQAQDKVTARKVELLIDTWQGPEESLRQRTQEAAQAEPDERTLIADEPTTVANEEIPGSDSEPYQELKKAERGDINVDQSRVTSIARSKERSGDETLHISSSLSRRLELEQEEYYQTMQEQANDVREESYSAPTPQLKPGSSTHGKPMTRQQIQDQATQRRRKKRRLRSRILQKLKGQEGSIEEASTNLHELASEESQTQAQLRDVTHFAQSDDKIQDSEDEPETLSQQMREAEDHILSAAETVEEVYEERGDSGSSLEQESSSISEHQIPKRSKDGAKRNTGFPGSKAGIELDVSINELSLPGRRNMLGMDEAGQNEARRYHPGRPKRKALHNYNELRVYLGDYNSQDRPTHLTDADERGAGDAGPNSALLTDRRITPFPGPLYSLKPSDAGTADSNSTKESGLYDSNPPTSALHKGDLTSGGHNTTRLHELSKRRRHLAEEADIHIRHPKGQPPNQVENWDFTKDEISSVENLQGELDRNRIYITSTVDIGELDSRQHPKHVRLWSWSKEENHQFHAQMDALLRKNFRLEMVSSNQHSVPRHYTTVTHMAYWTAHFEVDHSLYWLAILSPEPSADQSWEKVRRTEKASEVAVVKS